MTKNLIFATILLLFVPATLRTQIIDYYPRVDSLCIEGHCTHPIIILSEINGPAQDTLKISCWSTVWYPKRLEDIEDKGENIFYVIHDPENNHRYEVWIEDEDSLLQSNLRVPFNEHFIFYIKYFRLKVKVLSNDAVIDSVVQHFESFLQMGVNSNLNQSEASSGQVITNYPNPFNAQTTISYHLLTASDVSLKIFNSIGQEIKALITAYQPAGEYSVQWNPANPGTGIYYIQLKTRTGTFIKKCTLIK